MPVGRTARCASARPYPGPRTRRALVRPLTRLRAGDDSGFTLIEVLIAMAVIGTVMAALAVFFTNSLHFSGQQRDKQVAIQLAGDAIERARALKGTALPAGRSQTKTMAQWNSAPAAVRPYLLTTEPAWDLLLDASSGAGDTAPLPTAPNVVKVNGVEYTQNWYVGRCIQQGRPTTAPERACTSPAAPDPAPASADVPFYRVVASVTWKDAACEGGECAYVTSTLMSAAGDALFKIKRPAPMVTNPGVQYGYRTVEANLQLLASGGRLPLTWSATGLPPGLSMTSGGLVDNVTPTQVGTYTVTVTVTDRDKDTDTATFTWAVADPLEVTGPGDQSTRAGTAVSLPIASAGGHAPLTWTATGLPAGLSINDTTGVITGTPTTYETKTVTVKATDKAGKSDSVTFTWKVLTLALSDPGTRTNTVGNTVSGVYLTATGGRAPYTWSAENLPAGLQINASTGEIRGTVTAGTRYLPEVTVRDSAGDEVTRRFQWNVSVPAGTLAVTAPTATSQTGTVGTAVSLTATAGGGSGSGYVWTAAELPPGLTLTTASGRNAQVTGTPTTAGTYVVALKVTDSAQKSATLMFTWTVK
ncbi:putative Ig domain-containing protein [Planobispora siamensis]|uniref:Prepilin-type N-terminal cleavage/methylation domain-containing protein n=1 Tax=Planobispora siamensis TaxID=936338 RepID=A0A8J3S811_9ACTN|nr:putative Ig domain-containing protein [Planobispora siamensis]GIH89966.1 hypothetical protein Psi01_05960 [Planobispora siamensis]